MAAEVVVKEVNGAAGSPVATTSATPKFCTSDDPNPSSNYPLVVPEADYNYSYMKTFYLNANTAPSNSIGNIKWYCSSGFSAWTAIDVFAGTSDTYVQATGTEGTTGVEMTGKTNQANANTFTGGTMLSVPGSIGASTGKISDFVCLQARVGTGASAGDKANETVTWRYDET